MRGDHIVTEQNVKTEGLSNNKTPARVDLLSTCFVLQYQTAVLGTTEDL